MAKKRDPREQLTHSSFGCCEWATKNDPSKASISIDSIDCVECLRVRHALATSFGEGWNAGVFSGPCLHGRDPFERCDETDDPEGGGCDRLTPRQALELALVGRERKRVRAIVFKLFGKDYTGNDALRLIDSGGWP